MEIEKAKKAASLLNDEKIYRQNLDVISRIVNRKLEIHITFKLNESTCSYVYIPENLNNSVIDSLFSVFEAKLDSTIESIKSL